MAHALVVYASWTGSTEEIADFIAKTLEKDGIKTKTSAARENVILDQYDLFILGTSIHAGKTVGSFRKFLKLNRAVLSSKPVAFFVSCANMMNDTEETRAETMKWLEKAISPYPQLQPVSIGLFGGAVLPENKQRKKQNFFLQRIIKAMERNMAAEYGKTDFRDWEIIESWAKDLARHVK